MAKSDYLKMINYGEWLEKIFDKKIRPWQFRNLAQDAISFYNIDFPLGKEEYTLTIIETLLAERMGEEELFYNTLANSYSSLDKMISKNLDELKDKIRSARDQDDASRNKIVNEIRPITTKRLALYMVHFIIYHVCFFQALFKIIKIKHGPWDRTFYAMKSDKSTSMAKLLYQELLNYNEIISNDTLTELKEEQNLHRQFNDMLFCYDGLTENLVLEHDGCKKKFGLSRLWPDYSAEIAHPFYCADTTTSFHWPIMMTRIFIDFLILGGQDYYGFCEYCDKFFVVQRKGRKKYCSDVCRALASKERAST